MILSQLVRIAGDMRIILLSLAGATVALAAIVVDSGGAPAGQAKSDFSAVARYIFVPSRNAPIVDVIERKSDGVVGTLDLGLVPEQVVVSEATGKIAAIDGIASAVSIVDLANGRQVAIGLEFIPNRLIASPDGYLVAAADVSAGSVAFIELMRNRVNASMTGLSPIRDIMFGSDGAFLYLTAEHFNGVGVVDVARGKLIQDIAVPSLHSASITGLTRSPSGRMGYVKAQGNGTISLVDLSNFRPVGGIEVGRDAPKVFPTGFGGYLVVPDNSEKAVTIIATTSLTVAAMLEGAAGMATVYSGWFDTLALVPSSTERKLLVYDLDRLSRSPDIPLPGRPGPGAVTQDGARLYLALEDAGKVAVVDLEKRALLRTITVAENPSAAIMGKSFDFCH